MKKAQPVAMRSLSGRADLSPVALFNSLKIPIEFATS